MTNIISKILLNKKFFSKLNIHFFIVFFTLIPFYSSKFYGYENIKLDKTYLNRNLEHPYILGSGDLIKIKVSEFLPDLESIYRIDGEGKIFIPNLGNLYISGLTSKELEKILVEKFYEILYESNVQVEILQYRSLRVNVKGEVNSPGLITLPGQGEMISAKKKDNDSSMSDFNIENYPFINKNFPTLYDVIRKAGGITLNSDLENIIVIRKNSISKGGGQIKATINFLDYINNKNLNNNIRIFDEDIILIKQGNKLDKSTLKKAMKTNLNPKYIEVLITGKVVNKGKYTLSKITTLNDAIEFAGGKTPISGKVTLARIQGDGEVMKKTINYKKSHKPGSSFNPYLMEGDIIYVGSSNFNKASAIISEITAPISGIVNAYYLYKVFD